MSTWFIISKQKLLPVAITFIKTQPGIMQGLEIKLQYISLETDKKSKDIDP